MRERSDPLPFYDALRRWVLSDGAGFMALAVLVGILTGVASIGFVGLIRTFEGWFAAVRALLAHVSPVLTVSVPAFGGLAAGLLITYVAEEMRYGGIPPTLRAITLEGSRLRARLIWAKPLATALCIGTGGSAGRVGPIVQIGAALGSQVGQRFRLTDERIRNLVACGAAGGIAATFNAPIAGVIFALEVILGEFTESFFTPIVISAVTASIISRSVLGTAVAFVVPAYTLVQPLEIVFYVGLGGLAGLVAWVYITSFYGAKDLTARLGRVPPALRPALGGLLLGVLALLVPQILGMGFSQVGLALDGQLSLPLMAGLVAAKLLATDLTLGSGSSGGLFAPALFMGAMLGGAFGELLHLLLPGTALAPSGAYALVGMAAVFAAAAHAPMTSLLIIFEMSGSYSLILPLMLAAGLSTAMVRVFQRESIYTLSLARQGIHIRRGRESDVLERVRVDEVMVDAPVTVRLATTLAQLAALIDKTQHRGYPVLNDEDVLVGMISFQHLMSARVRWSNWEAHRVGDIYDRVLVTAYPDESVSVALQRMGSYDVSRLPVVARDAPSRLLGIVHRSDVGAAYQQALVYLGDRGREVQGRQAGERDASETVDLVVAAGAPAAGAPIRATPWPPGCLIVAVHRGDEVLVGRGDVVIEPGDRLTVYAREGSVPELAMLLRTEESGQQRPVD